ncbi:hypothetical protein DESC_40106 [Desulfosarcina cetonica]|nr:hypothetical protein DESC_40106 [Desulfosarcina cetonica]
MGSPSLTLAVFNDFHGQTDDAVRSELIATDEPGCELGAGIHYGSQFFRYRPLQIAQPISEEPDTDGIWIVMIVGLSYQVKVTDVR